MNSGKTLDMTLKLFLDYCSGRTILTNYWVSFPHYEINKDWLIHLSQNENTILENVSIGLDELWIWLDARDSQRNTVATYFFLQSSKSDAKIYFTAQHNDQNDKRLRQNLHKISQCSRVLFINNKFVTISDELRFLTPEQQKILYIKVIEFKKINMGFYSDVVPITTKYIKADKIFKLYNTKQVIRKQ